MDLSDEHASKHVVFEADVERRATKRLKSELEVSVSREKFFDGSRCRMKFRNWEISE